MTTTESNSSKSVADLSVQSNYAPSALSELQKISQLDEADEYGAVLTLRPEAEFHFAGTVATAAAPGISLGFLNQINQALMKCTSGAAVVECLLNSTRILQVAAHIEAWLYDPVTQRLRPSQKLEQRGCGPC